MARSRPRDAGAFPAQQDKGDHAAYDDHDAAACPADDYPRVGATTGVRL